MKASADRTHPIEILPGPHVPLQTDNQEIQNLIDTLIQRTGQPRANVEKWVAGVTRALKGGFTFYDASRTAGAFLAKRAQLAKPYLVRFGKALLQNYADQQWNLQPNSAENRKSASSPAAKRVKRTVRASTARKAGGRTCLDKSGPMLRRTAARTARTGYNPWAPPAVLQKEPLLILSYQLDKLQNSKHDSEIIS